MENMETNNTQQSGNSNGGQEPEKTFTQDEVNKIVSDRLARAKKSEADFEARERDLQKREAAMTAKELLKEKGLPDGFLDVLDYSDPEKIPGIIDKLKLGLDEYRAANPPKFVGVLPGQGVSGIPPADTEAAERKAFGLD